MSIKKKDTEKAFCCHLMLDILSFVFKINLPARNTFYHCTTFNMPDIGGKRHVIRVSYNTAYKQLYQ